MEKSILYLELEAAIKKYAEVQCTDFECAFRDALTDMCHMAEANGIDFQDRVDVAKHLFEEEKEQDHG